MENLIKPNQAVVDLREYKVASHEIWMESPQKRNEYLKIDWNESTIEPSPLVDKRIRELIDGGHFYYLYPQCKNDQLLDSISKYTGLPCENLQYFASSDSLEEYICRAFLDRFSRVLILSPSYDNFRLDAESAGAEILYSDMPRSFEFSESLFENDLNNYLPDFVYICNPNNPTGHQLSKEYIEHLLTSYPKTMFLIDEAYWEFSGITCQKLVLKYGNILITRTFSKAFGLANFRIGYLISSVENVRTINKIRNSKNITTFSQVAAMAALEDADYMWKYVEEVKQAREYTIHELKKFANIGKPYESQANFIMFECLSANIKESLLSYLKQHNIFIRNITQRPSVLRCVRLSIGTSEQMKRVVECFKDFSDSINTDGSNL